MKLSDLSLSDLKSRCQSSGVTFSTPPFVSNVQSTSENVIKNLMTMYGGYPLIENPEPVDFDVTVTHQRKWFKPQAQFYFDDYTPFLPLPADQDFAMLEWGLNWCFTNHANEYLILHAASIAKSSKAFILPGFPGAGKSTLSCDLMCNGWQLLSDELTLIDAQRKIIPCPRPVSLKNQSIKIIQQRHPNTPITNSAFDTAKGTVAHAKPSKLSLSYSTQPCEAVAVVFPKFEENATLHVEEMDRAEALVFLAEQGFNYHILGEEGFMRLRDITDRIRCFSLTYSSLDEANQWFNQQLDHV